METLNIILPVCKMKKFIPLIKKGVRNNFPVSMIELGYSSAALMAIIVAIPFAVRVLFHNEVGPWSNLYQAFFHTYLELYLGNSCLGVGVMMLVALTMERFVAVCHPEKSRALQGSHKAYVIIASIPVLTLLAHTPHMMRFSLVQCQTDDGFEKYQGKENQAFLSSTFYLVYKWFISLIFRLIPTILLAYLNLRIIVAYRRTCARRRLMTGKTSRDESKKFAEESRIMLLLGSTSVLFFVCVTPMVILSLMFTKSLLKSFSFQVFRSVANLLELTNYSLTFYIYCLFSREFRTTFLSFFKPKNGKKSPIVTNKISGGRGNQGSTPLDPPRGSSPLL
ncbi:putative G-protein coupled receptor AH9.1 [Folsomia candida]|uniref:Putative G-protein coupled receptor AH9.1 n=1 Tax=Folsomia candida TaxID=158441 RepID=A0A226DPI1_FOLCA|nr:putative G-protein coupled receptor AH9.1 [Folsomia candida]